MPQADDAVEQPELKLTFTGDVQRLQLNPEDVLLVRVPLGTLTDAIYEQIHASMTNLFGEHQKVLVLEGEIDIDVIAPQEHDG